MRRCLALWLPRWPTDRFSRDRHPRPAPTARAERSGLEKAHGPLVLIAPGAGGVRLQAVNAAAAAAGLTPGMMLAYARTLAPDLRTAPADAAGDDAALERLAEWCLRYTPWAAVWPTPAAEHALMLEITGCAHLFGGEAALLADLTHRLERHGIAARAAVADTPGAAWAWARFGPHRTAEAAIVPAAIPAPIAGRGGRKLLAALPVAALRLEAATVAELERLGLRSLGDVLDLPRAPLARRFGRLVADRVRQVLGEVAEPISPRRPPPARQTRLSFPEPVLHQDAIVAALDRLLAPLCDLLAREHQGARELALSLYRVDCTAQTIAIATGRPVRDPRALMRLFAEKLARIDAGFGIESAVLAATRAEPLAAAQLDLDGRARADDGVAAVLDRIRNRLGADWVTQAAVNESHIPERAMRIGPPGGSSIAPAAWAALPPRPVTLLPAPEPIIALAPVPDDPPLSFTWRRVNHRVARADGPERIDPEWWRTHRPAPHEPRPRDYYRVEDSDGRRYWIFRDGLYDGAPCGAPPQWYMHGLF
ncbi:MAG: DNA polymerase Y family protein [Rhodospirillaceae bacterium]|nr:DNA polymerase Y family protein [Rhodospirillaceae bacterium]